jgi:iron complex outermembrane receptor protein
MNKRTVLTTLHSNHDHPGLATALIVALLSQSALGAASAMAADAPADEASTGPLQEIVVTATRHEESLSKVPISVTALTQDALDLRGVKDFQDVARFTPGVNIDNSGTNNISIRGIASTGGAGTTGIYLDDTPIQMRALAFNPDEALPKSFDIDRVEVLRGPQGTLFGAGSEGGTVRYITTQPSLTKSSIYAREELSYTKGGEPSYEAGVAGGMPIIDGTLGVRASVWYRRDGGYIDRLDPVTLNTVEQNANYDQTMLVRLAAVWAPTDKLTVTPSYYYQDRYRNDVEEYWPLYSDPGHGRFFSANPTQRSAPDRFYLPALKIEWDLGATKLISNTSYYHRQEETGYDGTLYNLGFYQSFFGPGYTLQSPLMLDGNGLHLPAGATNYRAPASIDNGQQNFTQEIRLQSNDPAARLNWTTGLFFSTNRQRYLEQIHDPLLNQLTLAATGSNYTDIFTDVDGNPVPYDPRYPNDSYFLLTNAKDQQVAAYGEGTFSFTDQYKLTLGARFSKSKYSFTSTTGGPQLFNATTSVGADKTENSFTPKVSFSYQMDPRNLYYFTYAKGFRPGGGNNPVPYAACAADFTALGIPGAPLTFNSDTVNSFEVGAKNNFDNRVKISSSVYYIRWKNIQQTVLPPVCQITFISNLGTAVAKGLDIQAEIAVTDAFTVELATGYTDARYTQDSRLTPTEDPPVVQKGDAVTGQSAQPGVPFTATIGLQYKFTVFDRESFVRVDDEYEGRAKWPSPGQDPNTQQFDAANYTLSPTNFASARAGMTFGSWQVAAFVDNLTDTHTVTNYNWTIDPGDGESRLQRQFTFRPRTIGLTFTYRN